MVTLGGAFTITVISALPVLPPRSVAEARITCVPDRSRAVAIVPPVPSAPSRLELHDTRAVRSPSSTSVAVATRRTTSPGANVAPAAGAAIVTVGTAFTTTTIVAVARSPPASVTDAVIPWRPERSVVTASVPPVPSGPSRLERHATAAARSPSSRSCATARSRTDSPGMNVAPSAGAVMAIDGSAFTTTVRITAATLPRLSVTDAVMVWVPDRSASVRIVPPWPSTPSRLEVQMIDQVRSPSSASSATAENVACTPGTSRVPSAGTMIVRTGGLATASVMRASPVRPPASVTRATIVWMPGLSAAAVIEAPPPRTPSRSEVHTIRGPRSPLSASTAVALNATGVPRSTVVLGAGAVIVTTGARFCARETSSCGLPLVASRVA